jgi:uncharacterized protein
LLAAVEANDLPTASAVIKRGANVNQRGPLAYTALMIAAGRGYIQMTDILLAAGADIHALDSSLGASALHKAAQSGVVDVAHLLLDHGAFINLQSATVGHTPLIDAVWSKKPPMVKFLLDRGASLTITGHHGATVWNFIGNEVLWTAGFTNPEQEAWGHAIREMLEEHQRKDEQALNGQVLMLAVQRNDLAEIKRLIARGVDVNEKSPVLGSGNDGQTPLLVACFLGHTEIIRALVAAGANPRIVDYLLKATPAHKAAYAGRPQALAVLIEQELVELNAQGPYNGYTAIHDSVWHGHREALKVLLETDARLDLRGFDGNTALDLALALGYNDMAVLIREKIQAAGSAR